MIGLFRVTRPAVISVAKSVGAVPAGAHVGRAWKLKAAAAVPPDKPAAMHMLVMVAAAVLTPPPVMQVIESVNWACVPEMAHDPPLAEQVQVQARLSV